MKIRISLHRDHNIFFCITKYHRSYPPDSHSYLASTMTEQDNKTHNKRSKESLDEKLKDAIDDLHNKRSKYAPHEILIDVTPFAINEEVKMPCKMDKTTFYVYAAKNDNVVVEGSKKKIYKSGPLVAWLASNDINGTNIVDGINPPSKVDFVNITPKDNRASIVAKYWEYVAAEFKERNMEQVEESEEEEEEDEDEDSDTSSDTDSDEDEEDEDDEDEDEEEEASAKPKKRKRDDDTSSSGSDEDEEDDDDEDDD